MKERNFNYELFDDDDQLRRWMTFLAGTKAMGNAQSGLNKRFSLGAVQSNDDKVKWLFEAIKKVHKKEFRAKTLYYAMNPTTNSYDKQMYRYNRLLYLFRCIGLLEKIETRKAGIGCKYRRLYDLEDTDKLIEELPRMVDTYNKNLE